MLKKDDTRKTGGREFVASSSKSGGVTSLTGTEIDES